LGMEDAPPNLEPEIPGLRELPARLLAIREEMKDKEKEAEQKREEALREAERLCEEHGVDFDELRESFEKKHTGPPDLRAEHQRELLRAKAEEAAALGMPTDWLEEQIADEATYRSWQEHEAQLLAIYRSGAHHQSPA